MSPPAWKRELAKQVNDAIERHKQDEYVVVKFSGGKDSIAVLTLLLERGYDPEQLIVIYNYHFPGLRFIEAGLRYYEKKLGVTIVRIPHATIVSMLNGGEYMHPHWDAYVASLDYPRGKIDDFTEAYLTDRFGEEHGLWKAVGTTATDSVTRLLAFKRHGAERWSNRTFYPIADLSLPGILDIIRRNGVKLPPDYLMWPRSFDGLYHRFLQTIRVKHPDDYERIKRFFPLIDAEFYRYELAEKHGMVAKKKGRAKK